MTENALCARRLEYGHHDALFEPLTFTCARGEICAVLGANGCGKTTLLHTLTGILPALGGEVHCAGGLGFVPQSFTPTFAYRVFDIVLMGRAGSVGLLRMPTARDEEIARAALSALNIGSLAGRPFHTLSGGQRQLVLIARALATRGEILILDEPTAALDLANQQAVMRLIYRLARQQGISVLFTTHDPSHAALLADKTLLLLPGRQWLFGATDRVLNEPNLQRAYAMVVKRLDVDHQGRRYPVLAPLFDLTEQDNASGGA
ncbi:ABC transporter ATP-binding protein [Sodalis sp. RH21]|uniref:ABC transporter ATP-binding protein n=1 Tax=unclassified Sodalis (in: enterobacteria) TaxID=2636512 RepID=UPI0039B44C2F